VDRAHHAAEETLGLQGALVAVEAQEVVQVERRPGASGQCPVRSPGGQVRIAQGGVGRDLIEEDVDPSDGEPSHPRLAGADRGDLGAGEVGRHGRQEEAAERGGGRGDGQEVAHRRASSRRFK
jgi:hypothetical protein